jgi:predicted RecB family nuclease
MPRIGYIPAARLPYAPAMPPRAVGLSKSRVMAGLQCHKRLWWTVHEPTAPELQPDEALQAVFDEGTQVGEVARTYVPGGVLIDLPYNAYAERIKATAAALRQRTPVIYEASFRASQVYVSVDILESRSEGASVIEVKSTTSVKEQHLPDVAVQAHVLGHSGVEASRLEIMHLNRACAYPDLSNLFTRADVTERAHDALEAMPGVIREQLAMLADPLPDVAIGEHCRIPYECPFMGRCWPTRPPHHVSTLHSVGRRALVLEEQGYATIHDLPEGVQLRAIQDRQRRAVQAGQLIVEPGLAAALRAFQPPLAFLDFETVALPIPVWNGCHPYDAVPVQFSCHVEDAGGRVTHHEWLAEAPGDPRPALAERVIRACEPGRNVVAYNAGFERGCLIRMADALPALAGPLRSIADRLVDLLPVVRNHVYHPDFGGSFSLKSVLPAMVPELRYDTLAIGDGATASLELERLLFQEAELTPEATAQLRSDLLRYCHQDTWGLVKLLERLRHLARG